MTVKIANNWVWPEKIPPTKVYLHQNCKTPKREAEKELENVLKRGKAYLYQYQWLIALIQGEDNDTCIDLFGYKGLEEGVWPGNPSVRGWKYRNGVYRNTGDFTSTDGLILLGEEERLRRNRKDLETYIVTTLHPFDLHTRSR